MNYRAWVTLHNGEKAMDYYDYKDESFGDWYNRMVYGRKNVVFMQFTGLTYKNGKRIYERDVVLEDEEIKYTVQYIKGGFSPFVDCCHDLFNSWDISTYEVIGNVYEGG